MIFGLMQNKDALRELSKKWDLFPFDEILKDSSGGNVKIKSKDVINEGTLPVIDQGKEFISGFTNNIESKVKAKLPLIVFGDHTRILKYIDFDFAMGADGTKVLEIINENACPKFIYYFLTSVNITDTGYNRHFKYVKDLVFPLPPIETQQRIAEILDHAAALRDKTAQLLEEYDALAQSLFLEMFGDILENPEKSITLEKLCGRGQYGSGASAVEYDSTRPRYLRITDINENGELNNNEVSPSEYEDKYMLKENDLVFARSGATVGKTYLYNAKDGDLLYAGYLIKFSIPSQYSGKYFFYFTKTEKYKSWIKSRMNVVAQPNINAKQYGNDLKIPVPPIELQNEFAEKITLIEKQKELAKQELKESEDLFHSLLQKAFKGELA